METKTVSKDSSQETLVKIINGTVTIAQSWQMKSHVDVITLTENDFQLIVNYARKAGIKIK